MKEKTFILWIHFFFSEQGRSGFNKLAATEHLIIQEKIADQTLNNFLRKIFSDAQIMSTTEIQHVEYMLYAMGTFYCLQSALGTLGYTWVHSGYILGIF